MAWLAITPRLSVVSYLFRSTDHKKFTFHRKLIWHSLTAEHGEFRLHTLNRIIHCFNDKLNDDDDDHDDKLTVGYNRLYIISMVYYICYCQNLLTEALTSESGPVGRIFAKFSIEGRLCYLSSAIFFIQTHSSNKTCSYLCTIYNFACGSVLDRAGGVYTVEPFVAREGRESVRR